MISAVSVVLLIVLISCVVLLFAHKKLIASRMNLDEAKKDFASLIKDRLDIYLDIATYSAGNFKNAIELCENYLHEELSYILRNWAKIEKAMKPLLENDSDDIYNDTEALKKNADEIRTAETAYHNYAQVYNKKIARLPWKLVAIAVGLEAEKILLFTL